MHPLLLPVETHVSATDSLPYYYGGVYSCSISHLIIMFTLQYWDGRFAEWRDLVQSDDRDYLRLRKSGFIDQCGGCVHFRIDEQPTHTG